MLISLSDIKQKYNMNIKGIIHVGANLAQEAEVYDSNGIKRVIWVEALPDKYEEILPIVSKYKDHDVVCACVSDKDGDIVTFNVSSNDGQSSSFLEFGTHSTHHPDVTFVKQIQLETFKLDTILDETPLELFNMLVMDIQGAEYKALQGAFNMLYLMDWVYLEVNKEEVYKGCGLITEIDSFLKNERFEFERVETKWAGDTGWGDALYRRKFKLGKQMYVQEAMDYFNK